MAAGGVSLQNFQYFPPFCMLPQADELDANYYSENVQGMLLPSRTWCFVAEIVNDALSQEAVLGHRVEVRDLSGDIRSVLFYPEAGTLGFDFSELAAGCTLCIRYAQRCFFSDLATEAIKVEDMSFVKVIPSNMDALLYISQLCIDQGSRVCQACHADLSTLGGSVTRCEECGSSAYCSPGCRAANGAVHSSYCYLLRELRSVFNVDLERFTNFIPFR